MAYAPSIATGRCASSAPGQNWGSATADLGNADSRETEQNHGVIKYAIPHLNPQDSEGKPRPDFGRNGVENERQKTGSGIAKSVRSPW